MFKFIILTFTLLLCIGCNQTQVSEIDQNIPSEINKSNSAQTFTAETFMNDDKTWGYTILKEGNLYIKQPHIPAISGNAGFTSEEKALTTANYVISKLKDGNALPTVTVEELNSLNVLN